MTVAIKKIMGVPRLNIAKVGGKIFEPPYVSLLHFDGNDASTTFTDESGKTWTARGNAQLDTAQKMFGSASLLLDGDGDSIDTPDSADFDIGSGEFTVDLRVRFNALPTTGNAMSFYSQFVDVNNEQNFFIFRNASGLKIRLDLWNAGTSWVEYDTSDLTAVITTNTWYHVAVVRNGNVFSTYVDGVLKGSASGAFTLPNLSAVLSIGQRGTDMYLNGWIDEFRYLKGYARWLAAFTPPSVAYSANQIKKFMGVSNV